MNTKYFFEFRGIRDTLYRVEILTNDSVQAQSVTPSASPFILDYPAQKKLTPVHGSGASIRMTSQSSFQFRDLHTDDMQKYMVAFFHGSDTAPIWYGWLDSEMYSERLSDYPPYDAEFSASDFNILGRLKFRDENNAAYDDITTLIKQIKRCLDALGLPFRRLYIGCSTTCQNINVPANETLLHNLYIQSSNFYDEENEPMTCREVIESILQPFGLTVVQKNTDIYIVDYNTIAASGLILKGYRFDNMLYTGLTTIGDSGNDILDTGTVTTDGEYGFEEMINNTQIKSSIYANNPVFNETIEKEDLSEKHSDLTGRPHRLELFGRHSKIENPNGAEFAVYTNSDGSGNELIGAKLSYNNNPSPVRAEFRMKTNEYICGSEGSCALNVKVNAYVNSREHPFYEEEDEDDGDTYNKTNILILYCNLYTIDENGTVRKYYVNEASTGSSEPRGSEDGGNGRGNRWVSVSEEPFAQAKLALAFPASENTGVINRWITNSNIMHVLDLMENRPSIIFNYNTYVKDGLDIPLPTDVPVNGYIVFEITNLNSLLSSDNLPNTAPIINILLNNISLSITKDGKQASSDDYEFKSYINKRVVSDYEAITLNVISANEDQLPIGRANLLRRENGAYSLQLSFTRSGQTDILERLLMCTIHSNYTQKNEMFTVTVNMTALDKILTKVRYLPVLTGTYLVTGCRYDFFNSTTTLTATGFSSDTAQLSNIPYD